MSKARRTLLPGTTRASASALSLRVLPFLFLPVAPFSPCTTTVSKRRDPSRTRIKDGHAGGSRVTPGAHLPQWRGRAVCTSRCVPGGRGPTAARRRRASQAWNGPGAREPARLGGRRREGDCDAHGPLRLTRGPPRTEHRLGSGRARTSRGPRSAAQQAARLTRDSALENRKLSLTHLSACGLRCRLRAERGGMFARRREKG